MAPAPPHAVDGHHLPGEVVGGKYELVRLIGEGGMGSVWCARNLSLDSLVALKLLRPSGDAQEDAERLLQEARAAARLGHRAIVRVFDFGHTEQGDPFIVMELLEGESLAVVVKARARFSAVKSVQVLLPIIDALAAAHDEGIVHRDLKPENIFLVKEGRRTQPKVVDFGIAKVERSGLTRTLTQKGAVLGSPGYMSPEQARGLARTDHRVDIWGVCIVLYECVTGRSPFQGENYNALMRSIIEDPVPPLSTFSAGDEALWAILERGLRKDPQARWPSMREFGAALAGWLQSHGVEQDVSGDSLLGWSLAGGAGSGSPEEASAGETGTRAPMATRRFQHADPSSGIARRRRWLAAALAGIAVVAGATWWRIASSRVVEGRAGPAVGALLQMPAAAPPTQKIPTEATAVTPAQPEPAATPASSAAPRRSPTGPHAKKSPAPVAPARERPAELKDPY